MAMSFLVKSVRSGAVVATTTVEHNAKTLCDVLNKFALKEAGERGLPTSAEPVVFVEPVGVVSNPAYSRAKDPERVMLSALLVAALGDAVVPDDASGLTGGEPVAEDEPAAEVAQG